MKATLVGFDVTTATVTLKLDKPAVGAAIGEEWEADAAKKAPSAPNDGGPAFPCGYHPEGNSADHGGMSLRDWLAAQALNAYLSRDKVSMALSNERISQRDICVCCYDWADEMLKAKGHQ